MIELLEEELRSFSRQSSKGNQLKGLRMANGTRLIMPVMKGLQNMLYRLFSSFLLPRRMWRKS